MKFNKIRIDKSITKKRGIEEINISRLSSVIALVGKNGSGKTRILDILEANLFDKISILRFLDKSIVDPPKSLNNIIKELEPIKEALLLYEKISDDNKEKGYETVQNPNEINFKIKYSNNPDENRVETKKFNNLVLDASKIIETLKQNYLRRINYSEIQILQEAISDPTADGSINFEGLIDNISENNTYDEFKVIHKSALKFLAKLPHQLTFDTIDCLGDTSKFEKRVSQKRFLSLKKLIHDFLGKDLTWEKKSTKSVMTENGVQGNYSGFWKLDDREFNYAEFSDGEKTLFSYALLFFLIDQNPSLNIKDSIILVDEPELHLHPDSEIDLIDGMRNAVGEKGQLIIATHSINILSSLNYDEIFVVKNGIIKHPSESTIGESLSELMGIEERVNKLSDFISSIATWTFVNFMAECFTNPEVIESSRPDDPQIVAFKKAIESIAIKPSNLLLDFGAGKGRLYEQIKADYGFMEKVSYCALEPNSKFHGQLKALGAKEVYSDHSKLPQGKFDFILLCNVLHEIPILEWEKSLNSIISALKYGGYLIIIEAKVLTKGERIGKEGFLLLDIDEIQNLFKLRESPTSISIKGKEDLITCAVLPKDQLQLISKYDIVNTLKAVEDNTLAKIISLRDNFDDTKKETSGLGRKNAFLSQLHINSKIARINLDKFY